MTFSTLAQVSGRTGDAHFTLWTRCGLWFSCSCLFLLTSTLDARAQNAARPRQLEGETVALTRALLIDGTGAPVRSDHTVVFSGGRIIAVGPSSSIEIPDGAAVIDLTGRALLPGFVSLHEHTYFGDMNLAAQMKTSGPALLLAYGVTHAMTAGSPLPYHELNMKRAVDRGEIPGPRLHLSGPYIDQGDRLSFARNVESPQEAVRLVRYWAAEGVTWFKFMGRVTQSVLEAGIDEAHRLGLKAHGHLCAVTFNEAASLGIDALQHGLLMNTDYYSKKVRDECPAGYFAEYSDELDLGSTENKASLGRLAKSGVAVVSTLAIYESFTPERYELDPRVLPFLDPQTRQEVEERYRKKKEWGFIEPELFAKMMAWERAFAAQGGLLGAGSDPWNTGVLPGLGGIRNFELHIEAGFSPEEAIRIMTLNGARILGVDRDFGSIEVGKVADLVIVKGNPAGRPEDLYDIVTIFLDGVRFASAELRAAAQGKVGRE